MTVTANDFRLALSTSTTSTAFTAKAPTATAKTTSASTGVFDLTDPTLGLHQGKHVSKYIQLVPFGAVASDDNTLDVRLWGWNKTTGFLPGSTTVATVLYIPQLLVELNVTLSTVDGSAIETGGLMADTIVIAKGDADAPEISPANNLSGSILVHLRGCQIIEFDFDSTTGGNNTSNCYWRVVDL